MSLGDYMRFLRAKHGGESTLDIAKAIGLESPWPINEIEQRYRACGEDDLVAKLAEYYDVPIEDLMWRRERSRKRLSIFIQEAQEKQQEIVLTLRNETKLQGKVKWHDMGVILLKPSDDSSEIVVQRHIVDEWELA